VLHEWLDTHAWLFDERSTHSVDEDFLVDNNIGHVPGRTCRR
jgi:hypothetical protein